MKRQKIKLLWASGPKFNVVAWHSSFRLAVWQEGLEVGERNKLYLGDLAPDLTTDLVWIRWLKL